MPQSLSRSIEAPVFRQQQPTIAEESAGNIDFGSSDGRSEYRSSSQLPSARTVWLVALSTREELAPETHERRRHQIAETRKHPELSLLRSQALLDRLVLERISRGI